MFDDQNEPEEKSEVRQRMEAFYAAMSKKPHLVAFLTGMAASVATENKGEEKE